MVQMRIRNLIRMIERSISDEKVGIESIEPEYTVRRARGKEITNDDINKLMFLNKEIINKEKRVVEMENLLERINEKFEIN